MPNLVCLGIGASIQIQNAAELESKQATRLHLLHPASLVQLSQLEVALNLPKLASAEVVPVEGLMRESMIKATSLVQRYWAEPTFPWIFDPVYL